MAEHGTACSNRDSETCGLEGRNGDALVHQDRSDDVGLLQVQLRSREDAPQPVPAPRAPEVVVPHGPGLGKAPRGPGKAAGRPWAHMAWLLQVSVATDALLLQLRTGSSTASLVVVGLIVSLILLLLACYALVSLVAPGEGDEDEDDYAPQAKLVLKTRGAAVAKPLAPVETSHGTSTPAMIGSDAGGPVWPLERVNSRDSKSSAGAGAGNRPVERIDDNVSHAAGLAPPQAQEFVIHTPVPTTRGAEPARSGDEVGNRPPTLRGELSKSLVVPEEHEAVLLIPSMRQVPPGQAHAPIEITDATGTAVLGVCVTQEAAGRDGSAERLTLQTRDERTIAFCDVLAPKDSDPRGRAVCQVYHWSGELFGSLEKLPPGGAAGPIGGRQVPAPTLVFSSSGTARLFFYSDPFDGGTVINDESSSQVVTVKRQRDSGSKEVSVARLAPKADTALVLCCLLAHDRMDA